MLFEIKETLETLYRTEIVLSLIGDSHDPLGGNLYENTAASPIKRFSVIPRKDGNYDVRVAVVKDYCYHTEAGERFLWTSRLESRP